MSALSNIPPQAVLPLSAYDLEELRSAADYADQTFLYADCAGGTDKDSVLAQIAAGFSLPEHFGMNLDALYDCVTDLQPNKNANKPGFVVVLQSLPDTRKFDAIERNRILDVFRDAADYFDDNDVAFRVFYSVKPVKPVNQAKDQAKNAGQIKPGRAA